STNPAVSRVFHPWNTRDSPCRTGPSFHRRQAPITSASYGSPIVSAHQARCTMRTAALVLSVAVAASLPIAVRAQSTFGAVVGTVIDSTGAVLPGVSVTVVNDRTSVPRVVTTDGRGDFQVANVDAGTYTVTFSLAGFGERRLPTEVLARQTVRVDARLTIAGTSEQIEVRAASPVIETERATIDSSKSGDEIGKLALNFRATNNTSPIVVATLAQGVQQDRSGQISVAGALPFMTSFSVDGISTQR